MIREKGGAYGAGCTLGTNGSASFYSYRDPNSLSTFNNYEKAIQAVSSGTFNQDDIDSAKLTLFSKLDEITLNKDKLVNWFLTGFSETDDEIFRQQCLDVTQEQVKLVCEQYFLSAIQNNQTSKSIFGSSNNNLEGFVSRGWKIENFVKDLSLDPDHY